MNSTDTTIKAFYDFVCPFCYVGSKYADRLEEEFEVNFDWIGWEIHPETEKAGERRERLEHSFIIKRLAYDLNLKFSVPQVRANTRLALEGAEYAKNHGKFREYFERVMAEYWVKGRNISTLKSLTPIVQATGLDADEFSRSLQNHDYQNRVLGDAEADTLDIRYVPTFVFGGFRIVGNVPFYVLREAVKVHMRGYESII